MRKARPLIRAGYLSLGPGPDDTSCHLALSRCKINHFSNISATFMPKSSFICKKSGPAPILSPDPLLFLVYQIAQPYKESFCFFSKRRLLILIHPSILFNERQKPFEHLYPLRLHLPRIKNFPIRLHPIQQIMLLNPMTRRIPMISRR